MQTGMDDLNLLFPMSDAVCQNPKNRRLTTPSATLPFCLLQSQPVRNARFPVLGTPCTSAAAGPCPLSCHAHGADNTTQRSGVSASVPASCVQLARKMWKCDCVQLAELCVIFQFLPCPLRSGPSTRPSFRIWNTDTWQATTSLQSRRARDRLENEMQCELRRASKQPAASHGYPPARATCVARRRIPYRCRRCTH